MGGGENNNPKTPEERLAELTAGDRSLGGRKLKFNDQCAVFALLYGGLKNRFVARAFGLSATTVSNIGGCLEFDPHPRQREMVYDQSARIMVERERERDHNRGRNANRSRRYESVAREFEALGVQAFNRLYLSDEIMDRVERAKAEFRTEKRNPLPAPTKKLAEMSGREIREWRELHPGLEPSDYFA
jgi:hypothetical protein